MGGDSGGVMLDLTDLQEAAIQTANVEPAATQAPASTPAPDKETAE